MHLTITWDSNRNSIIEGFDFGTCNLDLNMDIDSPGSREAVMTYDYAGADSSIFHYEHLIRYHLDVCDKTHYGWAMITSLEHSLTVSSWSYSRNVTQRSNQTPQLSETVAGIGALTLGAVCLRKTNRTRESASMQTN
ncbi:hypothetical protein [Rubellicoccus peritrichatus]|uniref:Uncharacterized protein n=1 Tax=Rubellicoccus peritrichatus TaxID=3080537 RepID=A0AAQ3L8I9_9BACT|nr:hypothetical protein [Puniceicoccus sp. CR14]WOO39879.1 hypothetical protein RZN69_14735 [Puniceicoccus sp. CR14]